MQVCLISLREDAFEKAKLKPETEASLPRCAHTCPGTISEKENSQHSNKAGRRSGKHEFGSFDGSARFCRSICIYVCVCARFSRFEQKPHDLQPIN